MKNIFKLLPLLLTTISLTGVADFNDDLNDDAWDIILESQSRNDGGGSYTSVPQYYSGAVYGNKETGRIGYSYGDDLLINQQHSAKDIYQEDNINCQEIMSWEEACMTIIWSPSKKQFYHSIDTELEDEAIISALDSCKASGATDCTFKG